MIINDCIKWCIAGFYLFICMEYSCLEMNYNDVSYSFPTYKTDDQNRWEVIFSLSMADFFGRSQLSVTMKYIP